MKRKPFSPKSRTNYRRLRSTKSHDVLLSAEHPEADLKHIQDASVYGALNSEPLCADLRVAPAFVRSL